MRVQVGQMFLDDEVDPAREQTDTDIFECVYALLCQTLIHAFTNYFQKK